MEYNSEYTKYQVDRSIIRKLFRKLYLYHTKLYVKGRTIDFGCGVGELLNLLPKGSMGIEINKESVDYCLNKKLNVKLYDPKKDDYKLSDIKHGSYNCLIMSHVLEHFHNPDEILNKLFSSCDRIGIERIIIIVPCEKGFKFDKTHKTFINFSYLKNKNLQQVKCYKISKIKYFPLNFSLLKKYFTYNELIIIYDKF